MLKIRKHKGDGFATLTLSGQIEEAQLSELRKLLEGDVEAHATNVILDLEEVKLVDRETVQFLAACEAKGVKLKNCPSYIRKWIETGSE